MRASLALLLIVVSSSCSRHTPAPAKPRFGAVMSEVAHRFELAGRAMVANRFEMADFEIGEMQELFEDDLPNAELPKEGSTAAIPGLLDAFVKTYPAELSKAAKAKDHAAFATAFQVTATACNTCHLSSGHGYIQIPTTPGQSVPVLDPLTVP